MGVSFDKLIPLLSDSFQMASVLSVRRQQVSKKAKIRNRCNQEPHLSQDITWVSDKTTRELQIQVSQEASPFPAGDHKAVMKRQEGMTNKT